MKVIAVNHKPTYTKRLKARRVNSDGLLFDSISERDFYYSLRTVFLGAKIIRTCELKLPGKVRSWKCDFAIVAQNEAQAKSLGLLKASMDGILHTLSAAGLQNGILAKSILYVEFKGQTDLSTGLALIDKNFKSRIDWLSAYADEILDSFVVVGNGTGGIVSYCGQEDFHVMPIHSTEYFTQQGKKLWLQQ